MSFTTTWFIFLSCSMTFILKVFQSESGTMMFVRTFTPLLRRIFIHFYARLILMQLNLGKRTVKISRMGIAVIAGVLVLVGGGLALATSAGPVQTSSSTVGTSTYTTIIGGATVTLTGTYVIQPVQYVTTVTSVNATASTTTTWITTTTTTTTITLP